jgi:metal-dependent amidase/aminoacylase/carboxypeptidase family protein
MLLRYLFLVAAAGMSATPSAPSLRDRVDAELVRRAPEIIAFRRDLHRHPELSGSEVRTAGQVAARLRALGLRVQTGVGGHGVVATLTGRHPGPLVAYRADMDAFPSDAPDPVPFGSTVRGVRHICGHDLHTAIGLALAEGLAAVRGDLHGSVMFVFQPAEERATGANAMLAAGLFARERPVAIYALHTAPLPVGTLGTTAGALMPGHDAVAVTISGSGDLAGVASAVRRVLDGAGTVKPSQAAEPASPDFVLADFAAPERADGTRWVVRGRFTIADATVRERTRARLERELQALSTPAARVAMDYRPMSIAAGVTNDSSLASRASSAIRAVLGPNAVSDIAQIIPAFSEDFGYLQQRVPGVFYFLGVASMPHSPDFVADESAMLVGARAMTAVLLDRLGER